MFRIFSALHHPARTLVYALLSELGDHADRVLIGAWNPMLWPNWGLQGIAVNGITGSGPIPVSLSVSKQEEPDVRDGQPPSFLSGTVAVSALTPGKQYTLYRYEGTETLPTDGTSGTTATHKTPFTPTAATWTFKDGFPIRSSTAQYYRVFADSA